MSDSGDAAHTRPVKDLAIRLEAVDPDAGAALRIVVLFDQLGRGRAALAAAGAAFLHPLAKATQLKHILDRPLMPHERSNSPRKAIPPPVPSVTVPLSAALRLPGSGPPAPAHPSFMAYAMPAKLINGQWVIGRGGGNGGSAANWHIYPDTGWVGIVLCNYDGLPMQEILKREMQAVTGQR